MINNQGYVKIILVVLSLFGTVATVTTDNFTQPPHIPFNNYETSAVPSLNQINTAPTFAESTTPISTIESMPASETLTSPVNLTSTAPKPETNLFENIVKTISDFFSNTSNLISFSSTIPINSTIATTSTQPPFEINTTTPTSIIPTSPTQTTTQPSEIFLPSTEPSPTITQPNTTIISTQGPSIILTDPLVTPSSPTSYNETTQPTPTMTEPSLLIIPTQPTQITSTNPEPSSNLVSQILDQYITKPLQEILNSLSTNVTNSITSLFPENTITTITEPREDLAIPTQPSTQPVSLLSTSPVTTVTIASSQIQPLMQISPQINFQITRQVVDSCKLIIYEYEKQTKY